MNYAFSCNVFVDWIVWFISFLLNKGNKEFSMGKFWDEIHSNIGNFESDI